MNSLRLEADEAVAKVEELQARVKTLEQENLAKEQEITSLQHKNGVLETDVDKLETSIKDFKKSAEEGFFFPKDCNVGVLESNTRQPSTMKRVSTENEKVKMKSQNDKKLYRRAWPLAAYS